MSTTPKILLSTREAAEVLSVHIKTLSDYIRAGKIKAVRRGKGNYLIHEDELRKFLGLEPDEPLFPVQTEDSDVTKS